MEDVGMSYGHLEYIRTIWYILWPIGNLALIWYIWYRGNLSPARMSPLQYQSQCRPPQCRPAECRP
jgi:hypothetical protein